VSVHSAQISNVRPHQSAKSARLADSGSANSVLEEHTEKTHKEVHRDREVTLGHEKRCGDDIGRRSPKRALVLVQGYQAGEDSSASGVLVRRV
jgi:hypothetical protein